MEQFLYTFGLNEGSYDNPGTKQVRRLQRFLQGVLIARLRETSLALTLLGRDSYTLSFELDEMDATLTSGWIS